MTSEELREAFLSFFVERGHYRLEGASLIPADQTVMFTLAGMVPLKPYFTGERKPISRRLASCQRCLRTNDIENVGKTNFHHTFFEMLGNFSIGDYFKTDAIQWAWEFVTKTIGLPIGNIVITVHPEDEESKNIWKKLGVPENKIFGLKENFWMMGEVGPCGPDSEIHWDWTPDVPYPFTKSGELDTDDPRFVELWNIVFTQFDAKPNGVKEQLPSKNIDTGAGLERFCAVSQGVHSSFETDLFKPTMDAINKLVPGDGDRNRRNLIADHVRACTFLISDGVFPANDGRGYVLKRLIRRAALAGRKIGVENAFMADLATTVIDNYTKSYPFLTERKEAVQKILTTEEAQFRSTLAVGLQLLSDELAELKDKSNPLPGKIAFKLYDTYGFPLDLTQEIAAEDSYTIDIEGFNAELEAQRMRGRMAFTGQKEFEQSTALIAFRDETGWCRFEGYDKLEAHGKILGILTKNGSVSTATEGQIVQFSTDITPFYPEKGGQISDIGVAQANGCQMEIVDTTSPVEGLILHKARIIKGALKVGQDVTLTVDLDRRRKITKAHTATHLLHAGLRKVLGDHAFQAGSLVGDEELRFDFTNMGEVSKDDLIAVERYVNDKIVSNITLSTVETGIEQAKKMGAVALFGEKYGDKVRVVSVSNVSMEFCGGCHVATTGEIGTFKITSESSIGANLRRIEAKVGSKAIAHIQELEERLLDVASLLTCGSKQVKGKLEDLLDQYSELGKRNKALVATLAKEKAEIIEKLAKRVGTTHVIITRADGFDMEGLRMVADFALESFDHGVCAVLSKFGEACYMVVISKGIPPATLQCGKLITRVGNIVGFKGGGRPDLGQAGGIDHSKASQVLATLETELHSMLEK